MEHPFSLLPGSSGPQEWQPNPLSAHPPSSSSSLSSSSAEDSIQVYHPRFSRIYGIQLAGIAASEPTGQATAGAADPTPPSSSRNEDNGAKDPEQQQRREQGEGQKKRPFSFVITGAPRWNWIHALIVGVCLVAVACSVVAVVLSLRNQHHHHQHEGDGASGGVSGGVEVLASSTVSAPRATTMTGLEVGGSLSHSSRGEEGGHSSTKGRTASPSPPAPPSPSTPTLPSPPSPQATTQGLASFDAASSMDPVAGGSGDAAPMPVILTSPPPPPPGTSTADPVSSPSPETASSPPQPPPSSTPDQAPTPSWATFTLPTTPATIETSIGFGVRITPSSRAIIESTASPLPSAAAPAPGEAIPGQELWHSGPWPPHGGPLGPPEAGTRAWRASPGSHPKPEHHKRETGIEESVDEPRAARDAARERTVGFNKGEMALPSAMMKWSRIRNSTATRTRG